MDDDLRTGGAVGLRFEEVGCPFVGGQRPKIFVLLACAVMVCGAGCVLLAGSALSRPMPVRIGSPPPDLRAEVVAIPSGSGSVLSGWLCHAGHPRGIVVLMHGVRSNRLSMVERARFFREQGYDVLLFDFQAHGESPGKHITFGYRESRDAEAALAFARVKRPGGPVAAIGTSMGGAALLLAHHPLLLNALVLEAVYPTLEDAVSNRLADRLGLLGPPLAPLLLLQVGPRLGVPAEALRPIDHIGDVGCPVFVLGGTADDRTTPEETKRLFSAAREPKQLWLVPGAAHVDLARFAPAEYRRRVLEFLTSHAVLVSPVGLVNPAPRTPVP